MGSTVFRIPPSQPGAIRILNTVDPLALASNYYITCGKYSIKTSFTSHWSHSACIIHHILWGRPMCLLECKTLCGEPGMSYTVNQCKYATSHTMSSVWISDCHNTVDRLKWEDYTHCTLIMMQYTMYWAREMAA